VRLSSPSRSVTFAGTGAAIFSSTAVRLVQPQRNYECRLVAEPYAGEVFVFSEVRLLWQSSRSPCAILVRVRGT
jgi:hypothetical protein